MAEKKKSAAEVLYPNHPGAANPLTEEGAAEMAATRKEMDAAWTERISKLPKAEREAAMARYMRYQDNQIRTIAGRSDDAGV